MAAPVPYRKIPFAWTGPHLPARLPDRLRYRSIDPDNLVEVSGLAVRALSGALDRADLRRACGADPLQAMIDFFTLAQADFDWEPAWWQIAEDESGGAVGFVLPVLFRDGRDAHGRPEGTIYHMGVVPEHRGHGYGCDLLLRGAATLERAGVWRIFCDTDIRNTAMIRTFRNAGFAQAGEPYSRPL